MSDDKPKVNRVAIGIILFIFVAFTLPWLIPSQPKPTESPWVTQPFVDLSIDIVGASTKQDYRCNYYFQFGQPPKSLDFTGHADLSLAVQRVGRRTAKLQLITEAKTIDFEIGTAKKEIVLDDKRRISLAFLSSTLPPYDDSVLLSDAVEVFRHFHVKPIAGGDTVPPGMTKVELQSKLIRLLFTMLTQPHGWEGFDGRGDGYEIDVTIDGSPVHISMTFVSGWIVIKDKNDTRYYGFHPDRLKDLHLALDQYVALEADQQIEVLSPK